MPGQLTGGAAILPPLLFQPFRGGFLLKIYVLILEVVSIFIYPDNLTAKATLWLWELKDLAVVGVGLLLSVLALASWGLLLPLVLTVLYAFLSIRMEDASILDFLRNAVSFLFLRQQLYEWRARVE